MRLFLALAAIAALIGAAPPAGVTVTVRGPNGAPVKDAVVTVHLVGRATPAPQGGGSFASAARGDQRLGGFNWIALKQGCKGRC